MSEINAIATNNYLLATQQEVSHDNTLSGNGTVDSPLGVVPGYNETVLFDDSSNVGKANVSSYTLSESVNNFELVRISFARGQNFYGDQCFEFYVNSYPKMVTLECYDANGINMYRYFCSFSISGTTLAEITGKCGYTQTVGGSSTVNTNNWLHPYKVVGINRKA